MSLSLSACDGSALALASAGVEVGIEELADDKGNKELILDAVDVWSDEGVGAPTEYSVNDETMTFRLRKSEGLSFDPAWVRLGLFWHTKQKQIQVPVVIVGGPPVKLQELRIEAGSSRAALRPTKDMNFTPGKRPFDKELHAAVFAVSPRMLAAVSKADDVYVTIITNRGSLRVNLAVATGAGNDELAATAKYQFAEFYRRWKALQG